MLKGPSITLLMALWCLSVLLGGCGGSVLSSYEAKEATAGHAATEASPVSTAQSRLLASPVTPGGATQPALESSRETEPKGESATGMGAPANGNPLLIYQAQLTLAVYEVSKSLDAVEALAKKAGGYLVSRGDRIIVVRVPAKGFDSSLHEVLSLGEVLERNLQVEDVTAKVRDLEVRLKNAEAMRQRLTELLATATKTEEALAVERELARVTEDIEIMKAQLRGFAEMVSFSTITVRFEAPHAENLDRRFQLPFPWLPELGLSNLLRL